VLVGCSALSERFGLEPPARPEGLRIATFARGAAILGEVAPKGTNNIDYEMDRGTLFGVYEFLERVVGYRFYIHIKDDPDLGVVTPQVSEVSLPTDYSLERAPDLAFRSGGFATWADRPAWMRVTREGAGTGFVGANHTDGGFRKFRQDHPDWFALREDGARDHKYLCYSHPEVLQARLKIIQDCYDGEGGWTGHCAPGPKYITFVPDDVFSWNGRCYCDRCREAFQEERGRFGKFSNIIFRHGVQLAEEVQKRWPDKRVAMLAYEGYMLPPEFDLPDNLDVELCMMWSTTMGKEPYWHERNLQLLRDWSKKLGGARERLYVWNYYCWPAFWTEAPLFFPHNLQEWLQDAYEVSSGEFICPGGNPPQYEMLMCWLWHRLMWDRNADVDALIHDHCEKLFGRAARAMEDFYKTVIDRYERVRWSRRFNESYAPPEQIYGETYPPEVLAKLKGLMAEALAAVPGNGGNIHHRRVAWMQEGFEPFFDEAALAHKWLNHPPAYSVKTVAQAPTGDAAWKETPTLPLMQGNYGREPDLATQVAMARRGEDVFVRFEAAEPTKLAAEDQLALILKKDERELTLTAAGDGVLNGELRAVLLGSLHADQLWTVTLRLPGAVAGLPSGKAATLPAQISRRRAYRGAERTGKSAEYFWMPPMKPPWNWPTRFGQLRFEAAD
jgi:hypothetical protein